MMSLRLHSIFKEDYMEKKKICHSVWRGLFGGCIGAPKRKRYGALCGCGPAYGSLQTQRMPCGSYLEKGGFLTMDEDLFLRLTDIGREVAEQTYEKHCFFTHLLMEAAWSQK